MKRSRASCKACRTRKVKCDQAKPQCHRCVRNQRPCPGYERVFISASKYEPWAYQKREVQTMRGIMSSSPDAQPTSSATLENCQISIMDSPKMINGNSHLGEVSQDSSTEGPETNRSRKSSFVEPQGARDSLLSPDRQGDNITCPLLFDSDSDRQPSNIWRWELPPVPTPRNPEVEAHCSDIWDEIAPGLEPPFDGLSNLEELLNPPCLSILPPTRPALTATSPVLLEYYFTDIITLYCVWDTPLNPMRRLSETWQTCAALQHTMKSMAASCLARDFTELHSVAITERSKAYDLLNSEAAEETSDGCLLAIMLLGQTKSWRDPIDLAIDDLQRFRRILRQRQQDPRNQSNLDFFNGCLQYWEMLLSYVTDRPGLDTGIGRDFRNASNSAPPSEPHPFSGISQRLMHVLFDLGKLIFRVCITPSQPRWATEDYAHECIAVLNSARCLENTLLNYVPKRSPVTDGLGGSSNRTNELCELDRVYRYVGLMHLYRVFPDLLNARYRPWRLEDLLHPQTAIKVPTEMERREWLTELALHVLTCLQRLPFESRTISAQPWLLVAAASELRLRQTDRGTPTDASLLRVTKGRKFITSRLFAYAHMLPLQKIGVIIRLVEVIWSEFDAGKLDTFWVDIAYRQQLGTIMG